MFSPRVIRRELKSILHLLEEKNFKNMTLDGGSSLNISMVKEWMTPLMANYCIIFDMNCNKRSIPDVYCPHTFILTKNVQAQKQNDKSLKELKVICTLTKLFTPNTSTSDTVIYI